MPDSLLALSAVFAIPLLWAALSVLWREGAGLWLTAAGVLLQFAASLWLCAIVLRRGAWYVLLGDWALPLGIALRIDGAAAVFILLTALVAGACALHGQLYLRGHEASLQRWFWPLLWFLWTGLNGLWLSADLFNIYVGLELTSLCAVGLVAISGAPRALPAALRYLLAALGGSLVYLLGVALVYGARGTLALPVLVGQAQGATMTVALALMSAGLLVKTALFPLHGWLPPAHGSALTPVSALLSALVIKAPFYVLVRLWLELGKGIDLAAAATALAALGSAAIIWGSWKALCQARLKMVVAYSTVAQIGYFFLFFPLASQASLFGVAQARDGVLLLLISHALAKAAMFLAAGNLIASLGRDAVVELAGISRYQPLSLFSFGLAGVTLMGLPPTGAFAAKWLLLQSALAGGMWHWALVLAFGSLATAAYVFRIFRESFLEGPQVDVFNHSPRSMEAAPMLLAVASVLVGLFGAAPLRLLDVSTMLEGVL